ncbi:dipeptidylpeptidase [Apophysomyces sp. BC1015]|nr:dipeptidylpeptidase [Apophysomyces sp. BC1015]
MPVLIPQRASPPASSNNSQTTPQQAIDMRLDAPYQPIRGDPKLGGRNTDLVAFIRDRDIWVTDLEGHEVQLTFCSSNPAISCGVAEYLMQEEFCRYTGYYWGSPTATDHFDRILYLETSEEQVEQIYLKGSLLTQSDETQSVRYPRPGRANAVSDLRIVEFQMKSAAHPAEIRHKRLWGTNMQNTLPWSEYIVRFGWLPGGESVWAQILSRNQKQTAVLKMRCSEFLSSWEHEELGSQLAGSGTQPEILWQEKTDMWINVSDAYYFLKQSTPDFTKFIWSSEKSGFRHLYFVMKKHEWHAAEVTQLTHGDWCVLDKELYVDERRQLVYFMAKKDTCTEAHLYVTSYDNTSSSRPIACLTEPGFSHSVTLNTDMDIFVDCFSSLHHPHVIAIRRLNHDTLDHLPIIAEEMAALLKPIPRSPCDPLSSSDTAILSSSRQKFQVAATPTSPLEDVPKGDALEPRTINTLSRGEIFHFFNSDGVKLYGYLFKPIHYQAGMTYPTVLHIYGGPKTQLVMNDFKFPRQIRYLMSAYFGFAVVVIDGRGSWDRGLVFESHVKHQLGIVEMQDQLDGLKHINNTKFGAEPTQDGDIVSVVDLSRLAITGWSYGGYLSLMGLAQHPDIFKIAVAGAPVTQWELYDSAYTERYMGLPSENAEAYERSSVLSWIGGFPDRLLIAHGLIDDNVHFKHTESLTNKLSELKKPYYLQVYPTEKHGIRSANVNEHFETLMFYWLINYL